MDNNTQTHLGEVLDAVIAVVLILALVYLAVTGIISGQWAFLGLIGVGTGFGVWRLKLNERKQ